MRYARRPARNAGPFDSRLNSLLRQRRRNRCGCFAQDDTTFCFMESGGDARIPSRLNLLLRQMPRNEFGRLAQDDRVFIFYREWWGCEHPSDWRSSETFAGGLRSLQLPHYRFSMGTYFTGYSGPVYSARGRMRRLSSSCSMTCAAHPAMRLMAKIGVKRSMSMPSVV